MIHEEANLAVEAMTAIPFFPTEPAARALIADELVRMCATADQAMWLVRRSSQLFERWPGLREVRAVFCSRFKPQDGLEVDSVTFLDGVPSERAAVTAASKALPPADSEAGKILQEIAQGLQQRRRV